MNKIYIGADEVTSLREDITDKNRLYEKSAAAFTRAFVDRRPLEEGLLFF